MARALINVPAKAKRDEIIEIKTLISHVMETGFRPPPPAQSAARHHHALTCAYNGEEIFRAELYPAIAANPFITFFTRATESGTLTFPWTGDNGFSDDGVGHDHGRMNVGRTVLDCCRALAALGFGAALARNCAVGAPLRLRHDGRETRAMQDDDTANPATLWVLDGEALWNRKPAKQKRPARIVTAMHEKHEGRRRTLSGVRRGTAAGRS